MEGPPAYIGNIFIIQEKGNIGMVNNHATERAMQFLGGRFANLIVDYASIMKWKANYKTSNLPYFCCWAHSEQWMIRLMETMEAESNNVQFIIFWLEYDSLSDFRKCVVYIEKKVT